MNNATMKILSSCTFVLFMLSFTTATFAQNPLIGDNIVIDGDFEGDTLSAAWGTDGTATFGVSGGEASVTGLPGTGNSWDVQLFQELSNAQIAELAKGGDWELSFDARTTTDSTKTFHVFLGNNQQGGDWTRYWSDNYTFTSDTSITLKTNTEQTWDLMKLAFEVNHDAQDIFFDNVVLRRYEDNLLKDGQLVVGDSISTAWNTVGDGEKATYSVDNGEVKIADFVDFENIYDVQFIQELDAAQVDSIYAGPYEMLFDSRTSADTEKEIQVFFGNNGTGGDWTNWAPRVTVNGSMQTYKLNITADQNWSQMKIGFEVSSDASPIWFDNVIVRRVRDIPPAAPMFDLSTENGIVTITVQPVADATTYEVYFADSAFTAIEGGANVGTIVAEDGLTLTHTTTAPHPTLVENFTAHYGVTAKKENGTTSDLTTGSINTPMSAAENYIVELSSDAADALFDAVDFGPIPDGATIASYFPDTYKPFTINQERFFQSEGSAPDSDADLSAKFWIGYETSSGDNNMFVYAEITDDVFRFTPDIHIDGERGGQGWNFDSWEAGIGAYEPASFITGSDHSGFEGGAEPDFQLRSGLFANGVGYIHGYNENVGTINGDVPLSATRGDTTVAGMYRMLTSIATLDLTSVNADGADFVFPTGSDLTTVPMAIGVNDADDVTRESQVNWASRAGYGGWWNTPSSWEVVAFVGADAFPVSNEEEYSGNPVQFSLEQNYPNPFNPSTNIQFTLPAASDVTLEVFNMLGQKVATLLQAEKMNAGSHTQKFDASSLASGMYVYRISAANFVQSRKMMLIK